MVWRFRSLDFGLPLCSTDLGNFGSPAEAPWPSPWPWPWPQGELGECLVCALADGVDMITRLDTLSHVSRSAPSTSTRFWDYIFTHLFNIGRESEN